VSSHAIGKLHCSLSFTFHNMCYIPPFVLDVMLIVEPLSCRPFDCGIHSCQKFCHPPSPEPATCPFSPSKVTHCPCGKYAIAPQADGSLSSSTGEFAFPSRQSCTTPIPTCGSVCGKIQTLCGHECSAKCHLGSCPSCSVPMTRPCRCGVTTREIKCADFITGDGEKELLCDRPCTVVRACGKHECRRVCCPLASLAFGKGKKTRAAGTDAHSTGIGEEEGGLHECELLCGKMLTCGNHMCDKRDHRGPCLSCLRSTFEEVTSPSASH
jgi:transcriptional repressor NF-X1